MVCYRPRHRYGARSGRAFPGRWEDGQGDLSRKTSQRTPPLQPDLPNRDL